MNQQDNIFITVTHNHKCHCIAKAPAMAVGREWWIGKLDAPVVNYPMETHCLHLKTEFKDITFLCNEADFRNLIIMCVAAIGLPSENWLQSMVNISKQTPNQ